ncbi:MAG: S-layer homology domain-containing protein [Microcoleaceae cyanobacterium MO_207.B10]|nr:S-layer homology domain-containing protein [Microcoleaceae cyanobacterium MO_207.B10]
MSKSNPWQIGTSLLIALVITTTTAIPIISNLIKPAPVVAQTTKIFDDVPNNYWAKNYIDALANRGIINGFPDGKFRPNAPVTRTEYATMVTAALSKSKDNPSINFVDVSPYFWGYNAIKDATQMGFLSGYPGRIFEPNQNIPREQVLVSLANGLKYSATLPSTELLNYYQDAANISNYAKNSIAAATENNQVVNYPNIYSLEPRRKATRAEVAAFIYQALVNQGKAQTISSEYLVSVKSPVAKDFKLLQGTNIPVSYEQEKILVTQEEIVPLSLIVKSDLITSDGTVIIPAKTEVVGKLQPAGGGSKFVANELVFPNGEYLFINASSNVITNTETIRKGAKATSIVKNAALGAAAAAALARITGDKKIEAEEVLGGAGVGAVAGVFLGRRSVDLIVINPNTDLVLTLDSDLIITE